MHVDMDGDGVVAARVCRKGGRGINNGIHRRRQDGGIGWIEGGRAEGRGGEQVFALA